MVEYGNGVSQVAGQAGGGHAGGGAVDVGASISQFVSDTISTAPPAALLAGLIVIIVGLMILRRAF